MKKSLRIAVDGPGGAGKSSLAKGLARALGLVYVDTGALYRAVGLAAKRAGLTLRDGAVEDEDALVALLPSISVSARMTEDGQHVLLCGEDVEDKIRTPEMSMYSSAVSRVRAVREKLLDFQHRMIEAGGVVMDGRDIGTVVMPNADVKIFLSASVEDRAYRRVLELERRGAPADYETVLADMIARDKNDSERELSPLRPADDAVLLDNTGFEPEETLEAALKIVRDKVGAAL